MANVSLGMTGTRVASVQNMLIGTGYLTDGAMVCLEAVHRLLYNGSKRIMG